MGKAFVCVLGGGVKKIIIPNFLMYCFSAFFFFFCFYYTILSSDLRPPFGPMASWRLKVFCTLWWMLIGVFIIQSWMSFLVCSFLSLIPFSFRHHDVFSKVREHSVLVFFKKVPNAALYTWRSSHTDVKSCQKENEWQKKNRHTLGTMQIHSTKQYWKWGGVVSDFPLFFSCSYHRF